MNATPLRRHPWIAPIALAGLVVAGASPGLALLAGVTLALIRPQATPSSLRAWSKPLLQGGVILLGLSTDLGAVLRSGAHGIALSLSTLALVFAVALPVARLLGVPTRSAALVAAGTGICGGSAIAAAGAAIAASEVEMGSALGIVFLLNAVGLWLFPWLAHVLGLSPELFGTWSGLALHDLSSVVGAATTAGPAALAAAVSTKLARTLWIVPVAAVLGIALSPERRRGGWAKSFPLFLLGFLALAALRPYLPARDLVAGWSGTIAHRAFAGALFLTGAGLSAGRIRETGPRMGALGLLLWIATATLSLWALRAGF